MFKHYEMILCWLQMS